MNIGKMCPLPGENDEDFGNRCWSMGQGGADKRADWDTAKVKVMLAVNRAKYAQHPQLQQELLSTLPAKLHGNPFTTSWTHLGKEHSWALWNGLVQMLIREELRPSKEQDNDLIRSIIRDIGIYTYNRTRDSSPSSASALFLAQLRSHGLVHPFTCARCSFFEESYPTECSSCDIPNETYSIALSALQAEREADRMRTPVLLVTDIGADVDDTLALMALCGSGALKLIAAATTVNNGKQRAALARQWLRILKVPDDQVPILPYSDCNSAACQLPSGFVAFEDLDDPGVGEESDTPRALLELICKHGSRLVIVAIATLTPLAAAIKLDEIDASLGIMSDKAYNFRIDMAAAREVFERLNTLKIPVTLLGKHAAYQISMTKQDFESLDGPGVPSLAIAARDQMQAFKEQNPDQFYALFPIPEKFRDRDSASKYEWFNHLPGDVVSHPYDVLLTLMAEEDVSPFASRLFTRASLSDLVEAVGNSEPPAPHGVNDAQVVKNAMMMLIRRAIQRGYS